MSSQFAFCEQCDKGFWRQRSTKTTCSAACKQKKHRGIEPVPYWRINTTADRYEDFLALALEKEPKLATRLSEIKSRYGRNAMIAAIDVLHIALRGKGLDV